MNNATAKIVAVKGKELNTAIVKIQFMSVDDVMQETDVSRGMSSLLLSNLLSESQTVMHPLARIIKLIASCESINQLKSLVNATAEPGRGIYFTNKEEAA